MKVTATLREDPHLWECSCFFLFTLLLCSKAIAADKVDFERILATAKEQVFPALVYVKPIRESFASGEKRKQEVFGSGVIIREDGLVVTNNHVAEDAVRINCVLSDRRQIAAEVVGLDKDTDLALLRLKLSAEEACLPTAEWADSEAVESGQFVMALGAPYGFQRSISLGIVSNARQYFGSHTEYKYHTWIQTDAAINPGNSGGPLVNTEGRVIGINSAKISSMFAEGLGFAIPARVAQEVLRRLESEGRVRRAWLGVGLQPLVDYETNTITPAERGVLISYVEENSPAEAAGIRKHDLLIGVNGKQITAKYVEEIPAVMWLLGDLPVGATSTVHVLRQAEELSLPLVPRAKGDLEGGDFDCRRWNMTVKEINQFDTPRLYFQRKEGVYIQGVRYPGNARESGLRSEDIILKIDGQDIKTLTDVSAAYDSILNDTERPRKVMFQVLRNGMPRWFNLDYRKDYELQE